MNEVHSDVWLRHIVPSVSQCRHEGQLSTFTTQQTLPTSEAADSADPPNAENVPELQVMLLVRHRSQFRDRSLNNPTRNTF